jgi:hypothetical protein
MRKIKLKKNFFLQTCTKHNRLWYWLVSEKLSNHASTGTSENYTYEVSVTFGNTVHCNSSNSTEKKGKEFFYSLTQLQFSVHYTLYNK